MPANWRPNLIPIDIPTADQPGLCGSLLYQPAVFEYWLSTYGKLTHPHARHCPRRFSFPCIIDWDRSSCSPVTWSLRKCVLKFSMTSGCMSVAGFVLAMLDFRSFGISWSKILKSHLRISNLNQISVIPKLFIKSRYSHIFAICKHLPSLFPNSGSSHNTFYFKTHH